MNIINIQAAKTHLSRLVEQAANGEEIILAKAGKPLAKIIPFKTMRAPRTGGQLKGKIWECSDCWAPDEDDILNLGASLLPENESDFSGAFGMVAESAPVKYGTKSATKKKIRK